MAGWVTLKRRNETEPWEPAFPGHTNHKGAEKVWYALRTKGWNSRIVTAARWNEIQDEQAAEAFCPDCNEDVELCTCGQLSNK
jgi:hypothetical protein